MSREEFQATLRNFCESTYTNYHGYGYAAGYFQGLCTQMWDCLPPGKRKMFTEDMKRALITQQKTIIENVLKQNVKV